MDLAKDGKGIETDPVAREAAIEIRLVLPPGKALGLAVEACLLASERQQRPDQAAPLGGDPEQRAASRRANEPVEDGLDLVGGRVAGRDPVEAESRPRLLRRPVTGLARLRLEIRIARDLDPNRFERDPEPPAEPGAETLVLVGGAPQAVIYVKRDQRVLIQQRRQSVHEADGVGAARHQRQDPHLRLQQARSTHRVEHRCADGHM